MRCTTCGARNSEEAAWCTQCYAPFGEGGSEPPGTSDAAQVADPPDTDGRGSDALPPESAASATNVSRGASDVAAADVSRGASDAGPIGAPSPTSSPRIDRDVREIDGEIEWRCSTCGTWVVLEANVCATCGTVRTGFGDPVTRAAGPVDVPEQTLLGASMLLPGAGHLLAGRMGSGITRAALFLLWAAGGLWWVLSTQDGRSPGLVLLVGAAILWGATLLDVSAIAKQRTTEPFGVRGLLWTVVGVTGLLMLMVAFAAAGSLGS